MDKQQTAEKIDSLKGGLGAKLDELQRRAIAAKEAISPGNWWKNQWVRVGIGVAVGYAIGSRPRGAAAASHESLMHAIVRAGLVAATAILVRAALEGPERAPAS